MFKDRDDALRKMENALLEEESQEALLESLEEDDLQEYEELDSDPFEDGEDYLEYEPEDQPEAPKQSSGIMGLALLALGLMACILGVLVYAYLRFGRG